MEHNGYRGRKKEYFYSRLLDGKLHENLSGEENLRHGSEHKLVINEDCILQDTLCDQYIRNLSLPIGTIDNINWLQQLFF